MPFMPAKEVVHNQLMRFEAVRSFARDRHQTGIQSDPVRSRALFDELAGLLDQPVSQLQILELGPGRGTGLMQAAVEAGAKGYAAFDVEPYLRPEDLPDPSIDYRTDASGRLPWEPGTFDAVWSHSVLEHVRAPRGVLEQVLAVLKPGGTQVAEIDFVDHYQDRKDPAAMYNMLRYSDRMWNLMTSHRSSWTNRLRLSDWTALFEDVGFEIVAVDPFRIDVPVERFREQAYLADVSDEDLLTPGARYVVRRPA